jgi:hypothetical protein
MATQLSVSSGKIDNTDAGLTFVGILRQNARQFADRPAIVHLDTALT